MPNLQYCLTNFTHLTIIFGMLLGCEVNQRLSPTTDEEETMSTQVTDREVVINHMLRDMESVNILNDLSNIPNSMADDATIEQTLDRGVDAMIPSDCTEDTLGELYSTYIEPFVSGQVPSSCSQCHMTGIDISIYAQDTACDTMACMIDHEVVSFEDPTRSEILTQIALGGPASSVFDVNTEREAMELWINWSARCHHWVCGDIESGCSQGTGALSTGILPQGACSEDTLLASFWDAFVVHRNRCISCHSTLIPEQGSLFACQDTQDCASNELCLQGRCRVNDFIATPFLEGLHEASDWNNPEHRRVASNAMYTLLTMDVIDHQEILNSRLLTKPIPTDFKPSAVFGSVEPILEVPEGVGVGVEHGGDTKFILDCGEEYCVIDCREETPCGADADCGDLACQEGFCRAPNSLCDLTYVKFLSFIQTFKRCQ
jgi:hypothetical protein